MKRIWIVLLALCLLLSALPVTAAAEELETREFEGKTYINVTSKAVLDSLVAKMIANREEKLDVYCYHDTRDWPEEYGKDIRNFLPFRTQAIYDYHTYTVGSLGLDTYRKYIGNDVFTEEAYGTIDIRYLDTKEETAKADAIIDGVLAQISSYEIYDKLKYIADYVCASTEYGSIKIDGGYDMINGAWDVLSGVRTNTVCTSYAVTFQRFMERAQIPALMLTNDNHIWNMVQIGDLWYGIDCTSDMGDCIDRSYFLMGSESLARYPAGKLDPVGTFARSYPVAQKNYVKEPVPTSSTVSSEEPTSSAPASSAPVSSAPVPSTPVSSAPESSEPESSAPAEEIEIALQDTTLVKADQFQKAADQKVSLKLEGEAYRWVFEGEDLAQGAPDGEFDAAIFHENDMTNEEIARIQTAAKTDRILSFKFAHHGKLPAKATVTLRVDESFAGKTVELYSLDDADTPVWEATATVSADAMLTFSTDHCSLWYLAQKEEPADPMAPADPVEPAEPAPSNGWIWAVVGGALVLVAGIVILFLVKKKRRK